MSRIAAEVGFVHLRVHSAYSLLEGALPFDRLIDLAKRDRMPAIGLTDTGNLFGALEFSEKLAEYGIQPIIGCQVAVDFADGFDPGRRAGQATFADLVLLAADETGYWNLVRLVSRSFVETDGSERPHVRAEWLAEAAPGLIALTGAAAGPLDQVIRAGQPERAEERLARLID